MGRKKRKKAAPEQQEFEPIVDDEELNTGSEIDEAIQETYKELAAAEDEEQEEIPETEGSEPEPEVEEPEPEEKVEAEPEPEPVQDDIDPPTRWQVENKEWFNTQPKEVKEEISSHIKTIEGEATKFFQEIVPLKKQYGHIKEVVDHYMPEWHSRGISEPAHAIAELCSAQKMLTDDPIAGLERLINNMGMTVDQYVELRTQRFGNQAQTQAPQPQQPVQNPQIQGLTNQVQELQQWKQQAESQVQNDRVQQLADQVVAVRNERDESGRYLYPRLHDPQVLEQVQTLAAWVQERHPQLSWGECTKRAYHLNENMNGTPTANSARLPQDQDRIAKEAAISKRGRGASEEPDEQPIPDTVDAMIRQTYNELLGS